MRFSIKQLPPEDLREKFIPILRNPLLAKMFFLIKYIEEWGTGTNEMVEECVKHGLPEPEFEERRNSFVVTIRKKSLTREKIEKLGLNQRQIKGFEYIEKNDSITSSKYAEINSIAKRTARKDLSEMIEKGIIDKIGEGKNIRYKLCRNMPEYAGKEETKIENNKMDD